MITTNHLYNLRTDIVTGENGHISTTYGITVLKIEESIPNIFSDEIEAKNFISLCNREKLEPIHLHCVIEDLMVK